jgi:hypothetical protein
VALEDTSEVYAEMGELKRTIQKEACEIIWARFYRLHGRKFSPFKLFRLKRMLKKLRVISGF